MTQLIWLVTGCSSGFGKAFVPAILARGDRVIATARNLSAVESYDDPNFCVLTLDISASQNEIDRIIANAITKFGHVDVLVNNAGYVQGGIMEEISDEKFLEVYKTNLVGTVNVTRSIMPHFRQRRSGTVICFSSEAGIKAEVGASPYCASKFALEGAFETFQQETVFFGIKTLLVEPGSFRTELLSPAHVKAGPNSIEDYSGLYTAMMAGVAAVNGNQPGDPSKAVERIIDVVRSEGMAKGKEFPKRLPLGPDSLEHIRQKCLETLKICDEWEEVASSTNI